MIPKIEIDNLITSIEWHKKHCNLHDCNISIFHLRHLVIELISITKNQIDITENDRIIWKDKINTIGD